MTPARMSSDATTPMSSTDPSLDVPAGGWLWHHRQRLRLGLDGGRGRHGGIDGSLQGMGCGAATRRRGTGDSRSRGLHASGKPTHLLLEPSDAPLGRGEPAKGYDDGNDKTMTAKVIPNSMHRPSSTCTWSVVLVPAYHSGSNGRGNP